MSYIWYYSYATFPHILLKGKSYQYPFYGAYKVCTKDGDINTVEAFVEHFKCAYNNSDIRFRNGLVPLPWMNDASHIFYCGTSNKTLRMSGHRFTTILLKVKVIDPDISFKMTLYIGKELIKAKNINHFWRGSEITQSTSTLPHFGATYFNKETCAFERQYFDILFTSFSYSGYKYNIQHSKVHWFPHSHDVLPVLPKGKS